MGLEATHQEFSILDTQLVYSYPRRTPASTQDPGDGASLVVSVGRQESSSSFRLPSIVITQRNLP
jgi:hypothetical protein